MKKTLTNCLLLILIGGSVLSCKKEIDHRSDTQKVFQDVKANFQYPESISGVNCWWWWLNGNVNKAAITKDLEAMKSRNFQGP